MAQGGSAVAPKSAHVAAVAAVVFIAFTAWLLGGWSHGNSVTVIDDIVLIVLAVPAVVFAALAAQSARGRLRAAWVALTIGLLGWAVGEVIWTYYELNLHQSPFPSVADGAYLLLPIGACVAMLLFPNDRSSQSRGRLLLDGVIVAGSLFLVSWVTVLGPVYEAGAPDRLGFVISLAYPVSDVVILTVAAVVLLRARTEQRLPLTLLTAGMACIALSDSGFAYLNAKNQYASGDAIDIGWVAGLLLITVAAAAGREAAHSEDGSTVLPGWASIWLPYAPLLVAGIVAAAEPPRILQSTPVETVGALLVIAVLARQFLVVSENRRLLATVAEQALHDPLTGLANRALFNDRLDQAVELRRRDGVSVGVMILDLNDFKLVNDTLGHPAGDELLNRAAERLLGCVRTGDTVARLGGDEFVVLIDGKVEHSYVVAHLCRRTPGRGGLRPAVLGRGPRGVDAAQRRTGHCRRRRTGPFGRGDAEAGRCGDVLRQAVTDGWSAHLQRGAGVGQRCRQGRVAAGCATDGYVRRRGDGQAPRRTS